MEPRCCDRLSCWLEVITVKNVSTRLKAHLDRESGSANEYKTATRVWAGSNQVYCHAGSETRSGNSKMDAGIRAEENRKRCSFPTDLGSSGRSASDCQRTTEAPGTFQ